MTILPTELPPFGGLRSPRGHLPLVAMDVRAEVTGLLATTRVRQTFENVLDEPIEATYVFPLPDRAGVTAFTATLGGRVIEGLLKERQAARDDYDAAIAAGQRAAILEEDRPGVFSVRVGNLLAGEEAEIELVLTGPVPYDDGRAEYRFPLVVAPRYVPGTPLDGALTGEGTALDTDLVPDASRISPPVLLPGQPNPVSLSLDVTIDPLGLDLSDLRSTLPAVQIGDRTDLRIALRPGERLDRDFVLRFRLAGAVPVTAAALAPDEPGGAEGTFVVTVVPPAAIDGASAPVRPVDVAVVLDRSGSMAGWKMVAARRAAARIVDALTARDRLLVLGFDDRIEYPDRLNGTLVPATDRHRFAAVEFLAGLGARGGTDVHTALEQAAMALTSADSEPSRQPVVVLVTDGQVAQEDHILRMLAPTLERRTGAPRIFTVGIDQAVNAGFLRRLAEVGGGRCELVESEDALDDAMTRIHRAITPPLIERVTVQLQGADLLAATVTPHRPPDCYPGAPCVLSGRYRGQPTAVEVTGHRANGTPWRQVVQAVPVANRALRTSWARGYVRTLEDRYAMQPSDELAAEIVRVSLGHGVLSRFTAFVAVDRSDATGSTAPRPVIQPVEMPAGWAAPAAMPLMAMYPAAAGGAGGLDPRSEPMNLSRAVKPASPRAWTELLRTIRRLLDRAAALLRSPHEPSPEERDRLAAELDDLDDELRTATAPSGVRQAVADLARAVRSWDAVPEHVAALRTALGDDGDPEAALGPKRARFWR